MPLTPEVLWAQRSSPSAPEKNIIYLTISVAEVADSSLSLNLTSTQLTYSAKDRKGAEYSVTIDFFEEIDPENSRKLHNARATECVICKKVPKEEFWPRLTKEKVKLHWLKTDFDRWVDEDEQDGPAVEPEFDPSMMSQFGGGDDAGGFGGIDFSKLGGGQDLSGLGGPGGVGGLQGLEDDSEDDDEMPDLEDDKKAAAPISSEPGPGGKGKSKIEELD